MPPADPARVGTLHALIEQWREDVEARIVEAKRYCYGGDHDGDVLDDHLAEEFAAIAERKTCADELAAALAALSKEETQGWEPMVTAPKDGTRILAWDSYDDETVVFWSSKLSEWRLNVPGTYAEDSSHMFTHWMPLPSPPPVAAPGEKE